MNKAVRLPEYPDTQAMTIDLIPPLRRAAMAFEPYSDWNALSVWSWGERAAIASLSGNLVLQLPDYETGDLVTSLLGHCDVTAAALRLLEDVERLHLVPEPVAQACLRHPALAVAPDPDNDDYIMSLDHLSGARHPRARHVRRFRRRHGADASCEILDPSSGEVRVAALDLFDAWAELGGHDMDEAAAERAALTRAMEITRLGLGEVVATGVRIGGRLVAFEISELLQPPWVMCHFGKADHSFVGLSDFNDIWHVEVLSQQGSYTNWNWMQDLGLPGLREHKQRLHPTRTLRKFTIRKTG